MDELDQILSREQPLAPSPRFAATVMAAVRAEAAVPPPLPFPWKPALAGLAACVPATAWLCWAALRAGAPGGPAAAGASPGLALAVLALAGCYALVSVLVRRMDPGGLTELHG